MEWAAISFSRESTCWGSNPSLLHCRQILYHWATIVLSHFSQVQLFVTLWTVACQAPMFMGFSKQEYWGELTYPSVVDLPDPQYKPASLKSPALVGRFFTISATWEALRHLRSPSRWCVCVCAHACEQSVSRSCPTLWDPMGYSPPCSSVQRIFQAKILEWVAISISKGFPRPRDQTCISCIGRQTLFHCIIWDGVFPVAQW